MRTVITIIKLTELVVIVANILSIKNDDLRNIAFAIILSIHLLYRDYTDRCERDLNKKEDKERN